MKNQLFLEISKVKEKTRISNDDFKNYFSSGEYLNYKNTYKNENNYKIKLVSKFFEDSKLDEKYSGQYYFYKIGFQDSLDVEIFAKALFMLFYYRKHRKQEQSKQVQKIDIESLYIAIDFRKKEYAKEFVRIFSIFYLKFKENSYMENVQIAVCTKNKDTALDEVNFILAGKDLASAYETANNFVYYNADASLEFIPLLKFFKSGIDEHNDSNKKGNSESIKDEPNPIYPFDLFLKCENGNERSWFLREIHHRLQTDLWGEDYGCRISDITVRVGSKIKIDKFYEAELLFQNAGTVKRFAYLLALDIINSTSNNCKNNYLFLLAYENYSAVLIQEVENLLKDYAEAKKGKWYCVDNIYWLLDVRKHINLPTVSFERISENKLKGIIERLITDKKVEAAKDKTVKEETANVDTTNDKAPKIDCVTLVPINAVMATSYKLQSSFMNGLERKCKDLYGSTTLNEKEIFKETLRKKVDFSNYCLVAVGNYYLGIRLGKDEETEVKKYINKIEEGKNDNGFKTAVLTRKVNGGVEIKVKYLLSVESTWSGIDTFNNNQPLLQVDKTSTLIDTYFQSRMPDKVIEYYTVDEYILESTKNEK